MKSRLDYEIAAAKLEMVRIALLEGVRQCTAIWDDPETLEMVEDIDRKIEKLYNNLINQI